MKALVVSFLLVLPAALLLHAPPASAVVVGQIDTFENGTAENWLIGLPGGSFHAPPVNVPTGGPAGIGDHYMQLTEPGDDTGESPLTAINRTQWTGDYLSAGVALIQMNLKNYSASDLYIRLVFENTMSLYHVAISQAFRVPVGAGWMNAQFLITPQSLVLLQGDLNTLLSNVTSISIIHNPYPTLPPPRVTAQLGVDNIEALNAPTPVEQSTWGRIKRAFR